MARGLIDDHLDALAAALTVPPRLRRRALLEAHGHLLCAAERGTEAGLSPAEAAAAAVRDHGPPALIARRYAEMLALGAAQVATIAGLAAVIAFAALSAVATQISPVHASSGAAGAVSWFAVQIALTCAALSTARALRHRRDEAIPAGKLRLINRGWAVALGAVIVSLGMTIAGGGRTGLTVGALSAAVAAACALACLVLAARRTRELADHADEPAGEDALDDLCAIARRAADLVLPADAAQRARSLAARVAGLGAVRAFALRTHPWRCCLLTALAAGATVAATHLAGEGPATGGLLLTLGVAGLLVGIEALVIVGCFALLGSFLGIRAGYPAPGRDETSRAGPMTGRSRT